MKITNIRITKLEGAENLDPTIVPVLLQVAEKTLEPIIRKVVESGV